MEIAILAMGAFAAWMLFGSKGKPKTSVGAKTPYPLQALLAQSSILKEVKTSTIPYTNGTERMKNATLIFKAFKKAGYSDGIALSAVVNADYESKLSNQAVGDSGNSVGLFQVHKMHGMSVKDRMNPTKNIAFILEDFKKNGVKIVGMDSDGATVAVLSGRFGHDIERPADRIGALSKRASYARSLFPGLADLSSAQIKVYS